MYTCLEALPCSSMSITLYYMVTHLPHILPPTCQATNSVFNLFIHFSPSTSVFSGSSMSPAYLVVFLYTSLLIQPSLSIPFSCLSLLAQLETAVCLCAHAHTSCPLVHSLPARLLMIYSLICLLINHLPPINLFLYIPTHQSICPLLITLSHPSISSLAN